MLSLPVCIRIIVCIFVFESKFQNCKLVADLDFAHSNDISTKKKLVKTSPSSPAIPFEFRNLTVIKTVEIAIGQKKIRGNIPKYTG